LGAGTPRLEITFDMNDEGLLFNMVHPEDNAVCKYQTFRRWVDGAVKGSQDFAISPPVSRLRRRSCQHRACWNMMACLMAPILNKAETRILHLCRCGGFG
jgi:hypothetical protein